MSKKPPIINCHAHVFTGDYVPPYLAKTYLPAPVYRLLSLQWVIKLLRWYYTKIKPRYYTNSYRKSQQRKYKFEMIFRRSYILSILKLLFNTYITLAVFYYTIGWFVKPTVNYDNLIKKGLQKAYLWLDGLHIIPVITSTLLKVTVLLILFLLLKWVRNLAVAVLRQLKVLPGNEFIKLFHRYVQIGLFSKYKTQKGIYDKLKKQYPPDTHFIGLPMDMGAMDAGHIKKVYDAESKCFVDVPKMKGKNTPDAFHTIKHQMEGILAIKQRKQDKDTFHPFVFADPRRMQDKRYFDYTVDHSTGQVALVKGCLMQVYLEDHQFSGIKMYPALGYYPFEEQLLPLYKYCVQNNLPIMTHCIKGTIFYRGKKKPQWDTHPVFTEGKVDNTTKQQLDDDDKVDFDINATYIHAEDNALHLNQVKNIEFCNNFTNPLNYLCLLEEHLLQQVVAKATDPRIKTIFYATDNQWRNGGLQDLKLCFAHFGGDDQWKRFLESDRDNYTSQLILQPQKGIDFFNNTSGKPSPGKLAYIWKYVDWYTIICSIMLQYKNVYADISYILHDAVILPLLKQTLSNANLMPKVLYGSDFYVVRNHKSDKAILADMRAGLTEEEFDTIARYNPRDYLNLGVYLPHKAYGVPSN